MRLKYYLRGLGIGIMVTTVVLAISFAKHGNTMSDAEIIARAKELGMVMREDAGGHTLKEDPDAGDLDGDGQQSPAADGDVQAPSAEGDQGQQAPSVGGDQDQQAPIADGNQDQQAPTADGDQGQQTTVTQHEFTVERGDSSNMVSQRLAQMGLVDNADAFNHYMTENSFDSRLLPGKVMIPEGSTYEEIANILVDKELQR